MSFNSCCVLLIFTISGTIVLLLLCRYSVKYGKCYSSIGERKFMTKLDEGISVNYMLFLWACSF